MDKQPLLERDPLPESFASLEEAGEFWDTHCSADYEDLMEDVPFEIGLTRKPAKPRIPSPAPSPTPPSPAALRCRR
jgi:hypothetical protein